MRDKEGCWEGCLLIIGTALGAASLFTGIALLLMIGR